MSIFQNLFGGNTTPAPAPAPAPTQSSMNNPGAGQTDPNNPTIPPNATPPDPLESFKSLWEVETDPNKQVQSSEVYGQIDPKKVFESANKANFARVITPELMQAAQQGGEAGVNAMITAMNTIAQQVFAQSTLAATKLIDNAIGKNREQIFNEIPQHITKSLVTNQLRLDNPVLNNPAVAPIISAIESQLVTKFPQATPAEVTKMAQQYILNLSSVLNPQAPTIQEPKKPNEDDWTSFLN